MQSESENCNDFNVELNVLEEISVKLDNNEKAVERSISALESIKPQLNQTNVNEKIKQIEAIYKDIERFEQILNIEHENVNKLDKCLDEVVEKLIMPLQSEFSDIRDLDRLLNENTTNSMNTTTGEENAGGSAGAGASMGGGNGNGSGVSISVSTSNYLNRFSLLGAKATDLFIEKIMNPRSQRHPADQQIGVSECDGNTYSTAKKKPWISPSIEIPELKKIP
ncbi:hypothetical protein AX774_g2259 [Zancudomyces culisetae]|uniref:Uncharacterized protein n=1 Tax=Zancudomyces culisetae TaxID=1213189 RepID=A0A1R1PTF5_ZANCU|nr:hypothetical protein AX774_g2259 [Zancudomyces culisetae]|eukprot:OMH84224.1 hypothetical protein AX774_g2259 [Zancudomyces culisetae]